MRTSATFYHAGCPVCTAAESTLVSYLDASKVDLEIVHLGHDRGRLDEAAQAGVRSVPALVINGHALHLNHGADLEALR